MIGRFTLMDIRLVWDRIKPHIESIRTDLHMDWRCEDVYAQCMMGRAFCYTCEDGFVIVQPRENGYNLSKELFVWLCYSTAHDGLTEYYDDICAMAKSVHAKSIIFNSPRDGFRKVAKQKQWRTMTEYTLPVY